MIDYKQFYSKNAAGIKKSVIRELPKLISKPGIISFGGDQRLADVIRENLERNNVDSPIAPWRRNLRLKSL